MEMAQWGSRIRTRTALRRRTNDGAARNAPCHTARFSSPDKERARQAHGIDHCRRPFDRGRTCVPLRGIPTSLLTTCVLRRDERMCRVRPVKRDVARGGQGQFGPGGKLAAEEESMADAASFFALSATCLHRGPKFSESIWPGIVCMTGSRGPGGRSPGPRVNQPARDVQRTHGARQRARTSRRCLRRARCVGKRQKREPGWGTTERGSGGDTGELDVTRDGDSGPYETPCEDDQTEAYRHR